MSLESKLDLIIRGQHILMRASFSPNDPQKQAQHFVRLQNDINGWFNDYPIVLGETAGEGKEPGPLSEAEKCARDRNDDDPVVG